MPAQIRFGSGLTDRTPRRLALARTVTRPWRRSSQVTEGEEVWRFRWSIWTSKSAGSQPSDHAGRADAPRVPSDFEGYDVTAP